MSILHKAWPFDYDAFERELAAILFAALETDDVAPLRAFINEHYASMWGGRHAKTLGPDWEESLIAEAERPEHRQYLVQWYGDLAITRYYHDDEEMGLDYAWDVLHAYLRTVPAVRAWANELIRGFPFGPEDRLFDPGRQGTGFLDADTVKECDALLRGTEFPPPPPPGSELYAECYRKHADASEALETLKGIYADAAEQNKGLLLADFQ